MKSKFFWLVVVLLGATLRILPHEANIAPIGAITLLSAAYAPKKYAVAIPTASMLISDIFLGFHSTMLWVYSSFIIISFVGLFLRKNVNFKNVFLFSLVSSLLFYLVTNFGVWVSTNMYSKDFAGLLECYIMALPFFRNTIIGDMLYSSVLFAGFYFIFIKNRSTLGLLSVGFIKRKLSYQF